MAWPGVEDGPGWWGMGLGLVKYSDKFFFFLGGGAGCFVLCFGRFSRLRYVDSLLFCDVFWSFLFQPFTGFSI